MLQNFLSKWKFNKIYEFKCEIDGRPCDMKMTSVSGHLLGHDFEEKYRKWWSCPPAQLFDLPVTKSCQNESANNIKRTLEREVITSLHQIQKKLTTIANMLVNH